MIYVWAEETYKIYTGQNIQIIIDNKWNKKMLCNKGPEKTTTLFYMVYPYLLFMELKLGGVQ